MKTYAFFPMILCGVMVFGINFGTWVKGRMGL